MNRVWTYLCSALAFLSLLTMAGIAEKHLDQRYAKGYVVVKFRDEEVLKRVPGYKHRGMSAVIGKLGLPAGARIRETQVGKWRKQNRGEREDSAEDMSLFMYLDVPPGLSEDAVIDRVKNNPMVEYVEKDAIGYGGGTFPTNDEVYIWQWQLHGDTAAVGRIWAPEAWDISQGTSDVIIAVLDTGLKLDSPEFAGRIVSGYDFYNMDSDPTDDNNHGTAVASIICATPNNGYRMVGVDWHCKIMPLKVLGSGLDGNASDWALATYHAVSNGAKVINLSAGVWGGSTPLDDAIKFAVSNGVTFVTITHNEGMAEIRYPASMNETIAVGGITSTGTLWEFSNHGTNMDLVAPCTNIVVLLADAGENLDTNAFGTSVAAPMVSGAVGLMLAIDPTLNSDNIRDLLCAGADDQVSSDTNDLKGFDLHYGWGKLNIYNSLTLLQTKMDSAVVTNGANAYLSWPCADSVTNNEPFIVQWTDSLTNSLWTTESNITYSSGRAYWNGPSGGITSRFYRIGIKRYKSW